MRDLRKKLVQRSETRPARPPSGNPLEPALLRLRLRILAIATLRRAIRVLTGALALLGLKEIVRDHLLPHLVAAAAAGRGEAGAGTTARSAPQGGRYEDARQSAERDAARRDDAPLAAQRLALDLAHATLERIAVGSTPVLVGPWLSEVGFEILYWIPFLRWAAERYGLDRGRLVALSRGGAAVWYRDLCGGEVEIFDLVAPERFRLERQAWQLEAGGQKQVYPTAFDEEVLGLARRRLGGERVEVLHPSLMYGLLSGYWAGRSPAAVLRELTRHARLPAAEDGSLAARLPADYVAVRFYFRPSFPDTPANRAFAARCVHALVQRTEVVLLAPGVRVDEHEDFSPAAAAGVHRIDHIVRPEGNLAAQDAVIRRARAFIGTYGGLSYAALLHGVPAIGFYSDARHFLPVHLATAQSVARELGSSYVALDCKDVAALGLLGDMAGGGEPAPGVAAGRAAASPAEGTSARAAGRS